MPKGPKGEKRPAIVIGNALTVTKSATGEIEEDSARTKPHEALGHRDAKAPRT